MKNKIINFRLTTEQFDVIKAKSEGLNMTLSNYVLKSALEKDIIVIPGIKEFREQLRKLETELRRIGNNINQISLLAHSGNANFFNLEILCANQQQLVKGVDNIWQSLNLLRENRNRPKG